MHKKKEQLNRKNILQLLFLQLYYFFNSVPFNLKVVFVKFNGLLCRMQATGSDIDASDF